MNGYLVVSRGETVSKGRNRISRNLLRNNDFHKRIQLEYFIHCSRQDCYFTYGDFNLSTP